MTMAPSEPITISRAPSDPVAAFCNKLADPLEAVFNLIYLAAHLSEPKEVELRLKQALEQLAKVQRVVLSHCNEPEDRWKAS